MTMTTPVLCDPHDNVRCDNCSWTGVGTDVKPIHDIGDRIEAGNTVPAGECPECGCLSYVTASAVFKAEAADAITAVIVALQNRPERNAPDVVAVIELLGEAREHLRPSVHLHACQCGHGWTCTEDRDECDRTCPTCGRRRC